MNGAINKSVSWTFWVAAPANTPPHRTVSAAGLACPSVKICQYTIGPVFISVHVSARSASRQILAVIVVPVVLIHVKVLRDVRTFVADTRTDD